MPLDQVALAPNTGNLFYGKGKLFFDRFDTDNNPTGYLHLGWVEGFSLDMATTTKEVEGSIAGPKKVLKVVETGPRKVTGSFSAREWSAENLLLAVGGDVVGVDSTAGGSTGTAAQAGVTIIALDRWLQMQYMPAGGTALQDLRQLAKWNKSTTPWTALTAPAVTATHSAGSPVTLVAGKDYDLDYEAGLIIFYSAGPSFTGTTPAVTLPATSAITCQIYNTQIKTISPSFRPVVGKFLMIGTNEAGQRWRVQIWQSILKLKTKLDFIKDDFGKIDFDFECQDDETKHPASPYFLMEQIPDGSTLAT